MAKLIVKKLHDSVWKIFGCQHEAAVADRDVYRAKLRLRLGSEAASQIQDHVDAALGRIQTDVDPDIMTMRQFYELLALEKTVQEVKDQIDATAVFFDTDGFLSTKDVVLLLDGHGFMPTENVVKFLAMVRAADDETEGRRRLVEFLERAIKVGEAVRCDL